MADFEVTSMSSRGQVVIPQSIREQLGLREGEKFTVFSGGDAVILRKIKAPSKEEIEKMFRKTRAFAREHDIKKRDVAEAIRQVRQCKR